MRNLFERGLSANEIRRLFRLIDWVLLLPVALVQQFRDDLSAIEEEDKMPYVTSIERLGIEKGRDRTLKQNLQTLLNARFGNAADPLIQVIGAISDADLLETIFQRAAGGASLEELQQLGK